MSKAYRHEPILLAILALLVIPIAVISPAYSAQLPPESPVIAADLDDEFDAFDEEFEDGSDKEVFDPLSGYNRAMTHFNDKFYDWVAKPTAKGYQIVVPLPVRSSIGRFFKNLFFPLRFVNNFLQLKYKEAAIETARFTINSTIGLAGLFDPAWAWFHLEAHPEDFGQTLGFYGVGSGFHIVLPFLGPSNFRDFLGMVPDLYTTPFTYLPEAGVSYGAASGIEAYRRLNTISLDLGTYDIIRKDSLDLYILLRNMYEENRAMKIEE